jgi:stage II sporulation protein AA (anti-sigma F factor antagonist)
MRRIDHDRFQPLHTEVERHADGIVVLASGEIDLASVDGLRTQLLELLSSCRRLVLDLREVVFIDSTGLRSLLEVDGASRAAGVEFALVPGPPEVQRLFRLTGTDETLRFINPL